MKITTGVQNKAQKIVLYGPEGIGKSTFGSKFPDPLFSDTEGSTAFLDVARFEKPTSWAMLMAQAEFVKLNKPCKTYVIDTADWAEDLAKNHIISLKQGYKSIEDYGYGKGFTMLAEEWGRWLNKLSEIIEVGIHVVILAHAHTRKFEQPDETGSYDRWELKLEKKTAPLTKEWADAVLFATYEIYVENVDGQGASKGKNKARGGKRVMHTTHHPAWDAKNRWGLPSLMDFGYEAIENFLPKLDTEVKTVNPTVETTQPEQTTTVESTVTAQVEKLPKNIQDLMKVQGITEDDLRTYMSDIKGHFPKETPFENLPKDYLSGLAANWNAVVQAIRDNQEPVKLDITDNSITF